MARALLSIFLTIVGYVPYFWSILKERTKPHWFSWITWGLVNSIVCAGQYSDQGGAGSWVAGFTAIICILIAGLGLRQRKYNITFGDCIAFGCALLTIPIWYTTKSPLGSVLLSTFIDILGCYPTLRKSYIRPYEEAAFSWGMAALRSFVSFFALENYSLITMIFPIAMVFPNESIASTLLWRRHINCISP